MTEQQQSSFFGWAKVEVMGHQSHIGFVKTEAYGGAVLFRIDSPGAPEREYTLESPEYAEELTGVRRYCPKGSVVKRKERSPVSVLVGAGSIYRIIPCTEAVALQAIEREQRAELMVASLPAGAALPALEASDNSPFDTPGFDEEDEDEICEQCHQREVNCRC